MSDIYTSVLYILLEFPIDFKAEFWFYFHIQKLIHESELEYVNKVHSIHKFHLSWVVTCSNARESTDVSFKYEADFSSSTYSARFFEHECESCFSSFCSLVVI